MRTQGVKPGLELYLRRIDESSLLTPEEEKELCWRIIQENCPEARDRMIRSNLRLVVAIAKKYANRGLPLSDLIEEGNVGLLRAVEAYDPDQGARFATYAAWWIKQAIKRALINAVQPIHIPAYMVDLISRWKQAHKELEAKLDRTPSLQEMAEVLELPMRKVRMIRNALRAYQRPAQGDSRDGSDEASILAETLPDSRLPTPDEQVLTRDDLETVRQLLDRIDQREATILRLRFGLDGDEPLTLKQVGRIIGLTRERVRQIEIEALSKLNKRINSDDPFSNEHERLNGRRQSA